MRIYWDEALHPSRLRTQDPAVPTLTQWGFGALILLLAGTAAVAVRRRRQALT